MIKAPYIFVFLAALCSGCVSEKSCQVKNTADETYVTLSKDWHGIVPGICGFSTHSSISYVFELPDHKSEYVGSEIREIAQAVYYYTNSYDAQFPSIAPRGKSLSSCERVVMPSS
jgi:hypothetical protein